MATSKSKTKSKTKSKAKDVDMTNIKKAKSGGYQIQFIVKGKSYSGFSTDLSKAIKIRDKMRKKLKVVPNGAFKKTNQKGKKSFIPGTKKLMAVGITFTTFMSKGYETNYILVHWQDAEGNHKTKSYYCGRESTYSVKRGKEVYKKALEFRKAYEKAVLDETLEDFDPTKYNIGVKKSKKTARKTNKSSSNLKQKSVTLSRNRRRRLSR